MERKEYTAPTMRVIKLTPSNMIAGSFRATLDDVDIDIDDTPTDDEAGVKAYSVWDDDWSNK